MKIKTIINLHKLVTSVVVLGLMFLYKNFSVAAYIYLALHGTYGLMWLIKDALYPDKKWEEEIPILMGIITFIILGLYWVAPYILISNGSQPSPPLVAAVISTNLFGVLLHYVSDAQKYYTLKYKPGLITDGFFTRCRNTNYLGEVLIYLSFAMLAQHWLPFVILGIFFLGIFMPNMIKKDQSLSRYSEFTEYQTNSGLFLPKLFASKSSS
jgi:steroid 5-alpha reductase family enzyme